MCMCVCVCARVGTRGFITRAPMSSRPLGSSCVTSVSCGSLLPRCRRSNSSFRLAWKDEVRLAHEQTSMSSRELKIKTGRRGNKGKCGKNISTLRAVKHISFSVPDTRLAVWIQILPAQHDWTEFELAVCVWPRVWIPDRICEGSVMEPWMRMQARTLTTYKMKQPTCCMNLRSGARVRFLWIFTVTSPHRGGRWGVIYKRVQRGMYILASSQHQSFCQACVSFLLLKKKEASHDTSVVLTGNICSSPMCQFCRKELAWVVSTG